MACGLQVCTCGAIAIIPAHASIHLGLKLSPCGCVSCISSCFSGASHPCFPAVIDHFALPCRAFPPAFSRERRKQKYSNLQETVDELSGRLGQLNTLEAANSELQQRNTQLEVVVKEQNCQLQAQKEAITRQAQQLQTQVGLLAADLGLLAARITHSMLAAPCGRGLFLGT